MALSRVYGRTGYWASAEGGELNRRGARDYSNQVLTAMLGNRYSQPEYHPRYAEWKARVGRSQRGFWNLQSDLIKALTHFKEDGGWKGGIPADVMDSGGKSWFGDLDRGPAKSIAMYGIVTEFGGNYGKAGYHPARPVFWNIYKEFVITEWPRLHWVALNDIGRYWR